MPLETCLLINLSQTLSHIPWPTLPSHFPALLSLFPSLPSSPKKFHKGTAKDTLPLLGLLRK